MIEEYLHGVVEDMCYFLHCVHNEESKYEING